MTVCPALRSTRTIAPPCRRFPDPLRDRLNAQQCLGRNCWCLIQIHTTFSDWMALDLARVVKHRSSALTSYVELVERLVSSFVLPRLCSALSLVTCSSR